MSEKPDLCRTCGAEIIWIRTLAGKKMPCDAMADIVVKDPAAKGIYVDFSGLTFHARKAEPTDTNAPRQYAWTSHFATCPQADQHRKDVNRNGGR